jgi:hypothetical protein
MAASRGGLLQKRARPEELHRAYLGFRAFTLTPAGEFPTLPPEQVISGLRFLCESREDFYGLYGFPRSAVAKHRRALNWTWGKHATALAIRAPWDLRSRAEILWLGLQCLRSPFFARLAGFGRKSEEPR